MFIFFAHFSIWWVFSSFLLVSGYPLYFYVFYIYIGTIFLVWHLSFYILLWHMKSWLIFTIFPSVSHLISPLSWVLSQILVQKSVHYNLKWYINYFILYPINMKSSSWLYRIKILSSILFFSAHLFQFQNYIICTYAFTFFSIINVFTFLWLHIFLWRAVDQYDFIAFYVPFLSFYLSWFSIFLFLSLCLLFLLYNLQ